MLHEFLTSNREELIRRCRQKEARRSDPPKSVAAKERGVPRFLQQLIDTLRHEHLNLARNFVRTDPLPAVVGRAAALHGVELMRLGYSPDQVVRDYGDVCQSVTEMAIEQKLVINPNEFRTLNGCLDEAIADAVTAFGSDRKPSDQVETEALWDHLEGISDEQQRLIDTAIHAFSAIRTGSIGLSGATGTVLMHTLLELRTLAQSVGRVANGKPGPVRTAASAG